MAKFPALPFWTDAYLADCGHLTDAEHGRYIMLLIFLWRAPQHRLPNDDSWLARKFNRSEEQVRSDLRPLIREFCKCDGNWIRQKKLSKQYRYVEDHSKRMSDMAKARWEKKKTDAVAHATSKAPISISITQESSLRSDSIPAWVPKEAWDGFVEMRKRKAPLTERGIKLALTLLEKLKADGNDPEAVLNQSTLAGWKSLYPVKEESNGRSKADRPSAHRVFAEAAADLAGFDRSN